MALPAEFISRTKALLQDECTRLFEALHEEAPVSIRTNPSKTKHVPGRERVKWCDSGYYLPERPTFTFDPLFHAGTYYAQEASSMFLEQAVRAHVSQPVKCLDLCAAPGGKSTHLHSILPEGSLVVSNEVIRPRSYILSENLTKWGYPSSIVTNNDPEEIGRLTHLFDLIVADVPCSGEGMFRKDSDSTGQWSVANVELCAARQKRIIHDVWNALSPGGLLIYSTCTYNTEENEENIRYFMQELGARPLSVPVNEAWKITGALKYELPVYRFLPHLAKGEGFFLAVLQKPEGVREEVRQKAGGKKEKGKAGKDKFPEAPKQWLQTPGSFSFVSRGETLQAVPASQAEVYALLADTLRIVSAGITLGEVKGKDILPSQSLACSLMLDRNAFPTSEISWEQAIRYLRKEALTLPQDQEKGYVLLTYKEVPLGFVKHLGNRANNLYPQEWRIRTGYIPENIRLPE